MNKIINARYVIIFNLPAISFPMDISSSRTDGPLNSRKHIKIIKTFDNIFHIINTDPSRSKNKDIDLSIINHRINKLQSIPDKVLDPIKNDIYSLFFLFAHPTYLVRNSPCSCPTGDCNDDRGDAMTKS